MPNIAVLWDAEVEWNRDEPFSKSQMSNTYAYFSEIAKERGADTYLAKFKWFKDTKLEKGYYYNGENWEKVEDIEIDVVFDKYKFDEETEKLKQQIADTLPVLNNFELEKVCKDKLLTYKRFPDYVAETREATEENVREFLEEDGKAVLKPRFDFGGRGVKVIDGIDEFEPAENLLVQRFVDSRTGIEELGVGGVHDLRIVVVDGEPKLAYVRTPESGFISNVSRGGSMEFVDLEAVPEDAFEIVEEVKEEFREFEPAVYGVDMIFDENGRPWILELNSKPGLALYDDEEVKRRKTPYIEKVVETLVEMAE